MTRKNSEGKYDWFDWIKETEQRNARLWLLTTKSGLLILTAMGAALALALFIAKTVGIE